MSAVAPAWDVRHCLVTGGARGIGLAVTQALLARGARVTMLGRSSVAQERLIALAGSAEVAARLQAVSADVADPAAVGAVRVDRSQADLWRCFPLRHDRLRLVA